MTTKSDELPEQMPPHSFVHRHPNYILDDASKCICGLPKGDVAHITPTGQDARNAAEEIADYSITRRAMNCAVDAETVEAVISKHCAAGAVPTRADSPAVAQSARERVRRIVNDEFGSSQEVHLAHKLDRIVDRIAALITDAPPPPVDAEAMRRKCVEAARAKAEDFHEQAQRWGQHAKAEELPEAKLIDIQSQDACLSKYSALLVFATALESLEIGATAAEEK